MGKPWEKVISFEQSSLNSAHNPGDIADTELVQGDHVFLENKVLEVAPGRTLLTGCPLEGGAGIDGLWRSYNKDGDKYMLIACNGKIFYSSGSTPVQISLPTLPNSATTLTKNVKYSFINDNDKTLITNGYDPALEFDPKDKSLKLLGLDPPRFYKKIAYFESDEDSLISGDGHSHDTVIYRNDERTGTTKQSLKVTAGAGTTKNIIYTYATAQDFSQFSNGILISNDDYFVIWIYHRKRDYISTLSIDAWTSAGNYYRVTIPTANLDPVNLRDNQWTEVKIKKSYFLATGTPNWASIARMYFNVTAVTGEVQINFDNCYWKNTPIEAVRYKKIIDNFEGPSADWTASGCTISDETTNYYKEGTKSLKIVATGTSGYIKKSVTLDLTKFIDGVTSQISDQVHLWAYVNNTSTLTSLTVTLAETSGVKYFAKQLTVAGGDFNKSTSGGWTEIQIMKKDFTNTGSASWASITEIQIDFAGSIGVTIYFDDWCLQEASLIKELSSMEIDESNAWTFAADSTSGSGKFNDNTKYISSGSYSIALTVKAKKSFYATRVLTTPVDLTIFGAAETSGNNDVIGFWLYWDVFTSMRSIEVIVDINTGDFATDYYTYEVTPEELMALLNESNSKAIDLRNRSADVEIKKSKFTRVGDTSAKGWGTVKGYKFIVNSVTTGVVLQMTCYFDSLTMRRRRGITGIYQWCCLFENSAGVPSAQSEWSSQITITGTRVLLNRIPISADTDCVRRRIFRKGGNLGSDARETVVIEDNTTTQYFDDITDTLAGQLLDSPEIPTGTIRVPLGAKWVPEKFKNRTLLYRDPNNLDTLYYSNPGYSYAWSELQAKQFDSELLNAFIKDDILFANCKSGMKRIVDDLEETIVPQEIGLVKHCIGAWASTPVDELFAFVSYDGVYLFDGYKTFCLSEPGEGLGNVKNYFDSTNYDIDEAILFYRKKHLYVSVKSTSGTRYLLDCYMPSYSWKVT